MFHLLIQYIDLFLPANITFTLLLNEMDQWRKENMGTFSGDGPAHQLTNTDTPSSPDGFIQTNIRVFDSCLLKIALVHLDVFLCQQCCELGQVL